MRKSKKAVFGMLVAMVLSLGLMGGINGKSHDSSLQQISMGSAWLASGTEGGVSGAATALSVISGGIAINMASAGATAAPVTTTNPYGWGYWLVTGALAL
ncbi:MAG: hypothetical protein LBP56_09300 [Odoribacteraceae bacterium]|jgi:hypothetical protein|nr:hypothetical protein [Odoribacteraceae bacterium]